MTVGGWLKYGLNQAVGATARPLPGGWAVIRAAYSAGSRPDAPTHVTGRRVAKSLAPTILSKVASPSADRHSDAPT